MWSRSPTFGSRALVFAIVLTASVTLRLPGASAASKKVSIAILNLDDRGAGPDMAANMSAVIANELSRLTILQVISSRASTFGWVWLMSCSVMRYAVPTFPTLPVIR